MLEIDITNYFDDNEIYHTSEGSFAIIEVMSKNGYPHRVKAQFEFSGAHFPKTSQEPEYLAGLDIGTIWLLYRGKEKEIFRMAPGDAAQTPRDAALSTIDAAQDTIIDQIRNYILQQETVFAR